MRAEHRARLVWTTRLVAGWFFLRAVVLEVTGGVLDADRMSELVSTLFGVAAIGIAGLLLYRWAPTLRETALERDERASLPAWLRAERSSRVATVTAALGHLLYLLGDAGRDAARRLVEGQASLTWVAAFLARRDLRGAKVQTLSPAGPDTLAAVHTAEPRYLSRPDITEPIVATATRWRSERARGLVAVTAETGHARGDVLRDVAAALRGDAEVAILPEPGERYTTSHALHWLLAATGAGVPEGDLSLEGAVDALERPPWKRSSGSVVASPTARSSPATPGRIVADGIPTSKTHPDGASAAERFESYRATASAVFSAEPVAPPPAQDARCQAWRVDDLTFGRTAFSRTVFRRSLQHAKDGGAFLLEFVVGEQRGELGGHDFVMNDQCLVLRDLAHPFTSVAEADEILGVFIPRQRIHAHDALYSRRPVVSWALDTPQGQILLQTLRTTVAQLPRLDQAHAPATAAGFVGLVNGLLSVDSGLRDDPDTDRACVAAMKAHLVRHLHEPTLSPADLEGRFGCSRAKIYRLFREEGGVAAFIRDRRLLRCFHDLAQRREGEILVQQVAVRWGFVDPYHFSRLFQRTFGLCPSDVLHCEPGGDALGGASGSTGAHDIRSWVSGY